MEQVLRSALKKITKKELHQLLSLIYDNQINPACIEACLNSEQSEQISFNRLLEIINNLIDDKQSEKEKKKLPKFSEKILIDLLAKSISNKINFESFKNEIDNEIKKTNKFTP